jgi:hypothetical protein
MGLNKTSRGSFHTIEKKKKLMTLVELAYPNNALTYGIYRMRQTAVLAQYQFNKEYRSHSSQKH